MLTIETEGCNGAVKILWLLPPCRRQRLCFARLARLIQGLDSPAVSLLVRMVVMLRHRHYADMGNDTEKIVCLACINNAYPVFYLFTSPKVGDQQV